MMSRYWREVAIAVARSGVCVVLINPLTTADGHGRLQASSHVARIIRVPLVWPLSASSRATRAYSVCPPVDEPQGTINVDGNRGQSSVDSACAHPRPVPLAGCHKSGARCRPFECQGVRRPTAYGRAAETRAATLLVR